MHKNNGTDFTAGNETKLRKFMCCSTTKYRHDATTQWMHKRKVTNNNVTTSLLCIDFFAIRNEDIVVIRRHTLIENNKKKMTSFFWSYCLLLSLLFILSCYFCYILWIGFIIINWPEEEDVLQLLIFMMDDRSRRRI